jgi:ATP-dependent Zn protease
MTVHNAKPEQSERVQQLLKDHRPALENATQQLLKTETIDSAVVKQALTSAERKMVFAN